MDMNGVRLGAVVDVQNIMVDGLGVGDVGNVVLRDRQVLSEEGVVVAIIEANRNNLTKLIRVDLISRGFVFAKENANLLAQGANAVRKAVEKVKIIDSDRYLRSLASDALERFFFEQTHRRPMILPVVVEV
jgi:ribonuclease J